MKWIVFEAFLSGDGSVAEWEVAGSFEADGTSDRVVDLVKRYMPGLRGTPLRVTPWSEASPKQRTDAEYEDGIRGRSGRQPPIAGEAAGAVLELSRRAGYTVPQAERHLLMLLAPTGTIRWGGGIRQTEEGKLRVVIGIESQLLTEKQEAALSAVTAAAYVGFFDAATAGLPLTELTRIEEFFGSPLSQAYPKCSDVFKHFAITFWTFSALLRDLESQGLTGLLVTQVMQQVNGHLADLFFPFEGPAIVDPDRRKRDQRRFLEAFAPMMDVDSFIDGNPVLERERQRWQNSRS